MLAALLLAATPPTFMSYGPPGAVSCAAWSSMRGTGAGDQMQFWLLGVLSGYNLFSSRSDGDIAGGASSTDLLAWANRYCLEHPLDNHVQLARALVKELEHRKK
jgi:hypothetical protein